MPRHAVNAIGLRAMGSDRNPRADYRRATRPPLSRQAENAQYEQFLDWMDGKFKLPGDDSRNPEVGGADVPLLEGLQSGDLVATSGTGIKTKENAESDRAAAVQKRNIVLMLLAALTTGGAAGGALNMGMASSRVGAAPGIGRALFNTPGARMGAAAGAKHGDKLSRLDQALDVMPAFTRGAPAVAPALLAGITGAGTADYYNADIHPAVNWLWERPGDRIPEQASGANWGRPDPRGRRHGRIGR